MAGVAGPVVALIMFAVLGDQWTVRDCAIVMAVGQVICFPAVVLLCFFRDVPEDEENEDISIACDEEERADISANTQNGYEAPLLNGQLDSEVEVANSQEIATGGNDKADEEEALIEIDSEIDDSAAASNDEYINVVCNGCCRPRHRVIAVFIAVADVIAGLGAGMSIRYFPIFFVDNLKLGPVLVQILYVVGPLVQAMLMKISQKLALSIGRCRTTVLFKWIGIVLMFTMIAAYTVHLPSWLVCTIYVLRTGFMN